MPHRQQLTLLTSLFEYRRFRQVICFRSFHGFVLFCRNLVNGSLNDGAWRVTSLQRHKPAQRQIRRRLPAIAKKPDFDAAKLALFLLDPHPKMPDMGLSRKEATDLAAYIATLK
jgi:hypothetical protein